MMSKSAGRSSVTVTTELTLDFAEGQKFDVSEDTT